MRRKYAALIISPVFLLACIISYVSSVPLSISDFNHNMSGTLDTSLPGERYMLNATAILWSPDGKYLAFNSRHDGDGDVYLIDFSNYLMNPSSQQKGAVLLNITDTEREEGSFSWSPDSRYIVVSAYQDDNDDIFIVDIHDKKTIRLTTTQVSESNPVWSPDGKYIVFDSPSREGRVILRMDMIQGDTIELANGAFPRWSADGTRLAFLTSNASMEDAGTSLNVTDGDGSNASVLLPKSMFIAAYWSPNDDVLAYTGYFAGHFQLGIVDSHSQQRRLLSTGLERAFVTGWSFDGKKLSLLSDVSGNQDVYILSLADNEIVQIARTKFDEHYPTWSPTENMLAYWSVDPTKNEQKLIVQDMNAGKMYSLYSIPLYYSSYVTQDAK